MTYDNAVQVPKPEVARLSITSSARASSVGGTARPSALAVLRLRTNLNLVARSIGMSPDFAAFYVVVSSVLFADELYKPIMRKIMPL